jgi:hypothetical protein
MGKNENTELLEAAIIMKGDTVVQGLSSHTSFVV